MTDTEFLRRTYRRQVAAFPRVAALLSETDYVKRNLRHLDNSYTEVDPDTGLCLHSRAVRCGRCVAAS